MLQVVFCLPLLFSAPTRALAQQPTKGWDGLKAVKIGTYLHITLSNRKIRCMFDSADEEGLVCHKRQAGIDRAISLRRLDIRSIRARNETGSVMGGALIGAGVGAGLGAIVDSRINNPSATNNAKFTGGLARAGGLLGALLGLATEFVPGKLLYRAPIRCP